MGRLAEDALEVGRAADDGEMRRCGCAAANGGITAINCSACTSESLLIVTTLPSICTSAGAAACASLLPPVPNSAVDGPSLSAIALHEKASITEIRLITCELVDFPLRTRTEEDSENARPQKGPTFPLARSLNFPSTP